MGLDVQTGKERINMFVSVNGVKLFLEVMGPKLMPDGPRVRERPTVLALHGGPTDHAHMRDMVSGLNDVAQVILYDHRGCGRSGSGDPALWTMEQWGDDVRALSDVLGLETPIVIGASFGGFVAQAYAARHPGHASKVGLIVTGARENIDWSVAAFQRLGGDIAGASARSFLERPGPDTGAAFMRDCRHLYTTTHKVDADLAARTRMNQDLLLAYFRDFQHLDLRPLLPQIRGEVLILGGDDDPILPPQFQEELAAGLSNAHVTCKSFAKAGHFLHIDAKDAYFGALRDFVLGGDR
jgi:pimeloyl-ACP methyl ester carboxylesterase